VIFSFNSLKLFSIVQLLLQCELKIQDKRPISGKPAGLPPMPGLNAGSVWGN